MINTTLATITEEVPESFTCDCCQQTFSIKVGKDLSGREYRYWEKEFAVIRVDWGYFSKDQNGQSMDLERHEATVCDSCWKPAMERAGIKFKNSEHLAFPE